MEELHCQSCGMPMGEETLLGTEKDGTRNRDYCVFCYADGAFTQPDMTLEAMKEVCLPFLRQVGMPEEQARALLDENLPRLKRWAG
ncbi:MAG: transcriptional regulator [Firmicutes bacterium]|nr:transcriptional regulator [Bacillota bacterium]